MYGERLKRLRLSKRWTQEEVANRIGVSKQTYSHYEKEKRRPNLENVRKLSEVFEVEIDYIFAEGVGDGKTEGDAEAELLDEIKQIADRHGMDLNDPRTLELLDDAFDFIRRMQNK